MNEEYGTLGAVRYIRKDRLTDGGYYYGRCRNASIGRWCALTQRFYYWRYKFGGQYVENIRVPEDDDGYDLFFAEAPIEKTPLIRDIPLPRESAAPVNPEEQPKR